jgi:hypothetical protein
MTSPAMRVGVLVLAGLATVLAIQMALGRLRRAQGRAVPEPRASATRAVTKLSTLEVRAVGPMVEVMGQAVIFNRHPRTFRYLWSLRVSEPRASGHVFLERVYRHQVFTLPAGQSRVAPTFHETVELLPGRYHVRLSLHEIPGNVDVAAYAVNPGQDGVSRFREVVVGD